MELLLVIMVVFLVVVLAMLAAAGVMLGMAGWRLDMRNRVDVNHSSPAPLSWLIAPTETAALHRRLRDSSTMTRRIGPLTETAAPGTTDDLRLKILQQAALLDRDLAGAGRAPRRHRRELMKTIRPQVQELEKLSLRVNELSRRSRGTNLPPGVDPPDVALGHIAERVELLENAEAELADVERANGLLDAERLIRESQPTREPAPQPAPPQPQLPSSNSQPIPQMPTPLRGTTRPRPAAPPQPRPVRQPRR
jgi:hypothetical protein